MTFLKKILSFLPPLKIALSPQKTALRRRSFILPVILAITALSAQAIFHWKSFSKESTIIHNIDYNINLMEAVSNLSVAL